MGHDGYAVGGAVTMGSLTCGLGGRQSARQAIEEQIKRMEAEIKRLRALLDALPAKLSGDADEALWQLVVRN